MRKLSVVIAALFLLGALPAYAQGTAAEPAPSGAGGAATGGSTATPPAGGEMAPTEKSKKAKKTKKSKKHSKKTSEEGADGGM
ncbi:MAG TPA: hypothetical protein VMK12_19190 [Anaeromyxobacteraceae bacterium]|nr:hypothetical protein [Anaeromyxobacteraceae bacterium]